MEDMAEAGMLHDSAEESLIRKFEGLHRRTQIKWLRKLAQEALTAYDLPPATLTLVVHLYNTTFRVGTSTGQSYILHINRSSNRSVEHMGAELAWLAALRRDTDLEVPSPVLTRDGSLLTVAFTPELPQGYICVLFRWMTGRILTKGLTPDHLRCVGVLMGRLQNHAAEWVSGEERTVALARNRVDYAIDFTKHLPDPFALEAIARMHDLAERTLSKGEAAQIREALIRVRDVEEVLGKGPDAFGLMHADLHYRNLLFEVGTVKAIDFGDCGFGPFLFDHAVMLSELLNWPGYPALRAALIEGYRQVRTLSAEHESYIDTFIALRRLQDSLWILELQKHAALEEDWAGRARRNLAALPMLLG